MKKFAIATVSVLALSLASAGLLADGKDRHQSPKEARQGKSDGGNAEHDEWAGRAGDPGKVSRTVEVSMSDNMRFTPSMIRVKRGETVKFVVKNSGRIKHEMVIGSMAELKEHAEMMRKMPGMEHAESNQVNVDPGKSEVLVWQFTKAGRVDFACLVPGHFEAGMVGKVVVKRLIRPEEDHAGRNFPRRLPDSRA